MASWLTSLRWAGLERRVGELRPSAVPSTAMQLCEPEKAPLVPRVIYRHRPCVPSPQCTIKMHYEGIIFI